jgi:uncharacterized integral membrane protein
MSEPGNPSTNSPADFSQSGAGFSPSEPLAGQPGQLPGEPVAYEGSTSGLAEPTHPAPGFNEKGRVRPTRVSGVWVGSIVTALFLVLLVIFIAQNSRQVSIHFFGWHGQFSLALTVLLSAVIGVLLVAVPGSVRILQLRRSLRRNVPGGRIS